MRSTDSELKRSDQLHSAANEARAVLQRVAGEGGVLSQIGDGEWDDDLSPTAVTDLTDLLRSMTEVVRRGRATAGAMDFGNDQEIPQLPAIEMLASGLPLNRKERYYTGTVLPMIVATDDFAHLHRFLDLCGVPADVFSADKYPRVSRRLQFFTEYSFVESVVTDADLTRFDNVPTANDTPDLVLVGDDWLLAVEAKMFHNPSPQALNAQLARQRTIVDYLAASLRIPADRVVHVLLLPKQLAAEGLDAPIVTWQDVLHAYRNVGPEYWVAMLAVALDRYGDLVSRARTFGANSDESMTGAAIVAAHADGTLEFTYMGRSRGIDGAPVADDFATGAWRGRGYEVRRERLDAPNWFPIAEFIAHTANP